jgi:hypothetical protein
VSRLLNRKAAKATPRTLSCGSSTQHGSARTCSVDTKSATPSTGTIVPMSCVVSSGVITTAAIVLAVVIMTDRPTSARARYVMMLLAVLHARACFAAGCKCRRCVKVALAVLYACAKCLTKCLTA